MSAIDDILRSLGFDSFQTLFETDRGNVLHASFPGGGEAVQTWRALRKLAAQTKHWPVILGDEDSAPDFKTMIEDGFSVEQTLAYMEKLSPLDWLKEQLALKDDNPSEFDGAGHDWPDDDFEPGANFAVPYNAISGQPLQRVIIALVPTILPWRVPAFLNLGSWNDCPEPAVHCIMHRYWNEQYGAEMVCATHDVIEMNVTRPPETRKAALRLANEQFLYCADIVTQGTQTISRLAAALLNQHRWFFWWD